MNDDEKDPSAGPDTRINLYLRRMARIRYPEDVMAIRRAVPAVAPLTNYEIQELYHAYSEDQYCASWMMLDCVSLGDFGDWLVEVVPHFTVEPY